MTADPMMLSLVLASGSTPAAVTAVEGDTAREPDDRRIRVQFGAASIFLRAGDAVEFAASVLTASILAKTATPPESTLTPVAS